MRLPVFRSLPTLAVAATLTALACAPMYFVPQHWHVGSPMQLPLTAVDRSLPFWPLTGLVYFAVFPLLAGTLLSLRSFEHASRFLYANILAQLIGMLVFVLWPTTYPRGDFPLPADTGSLGAALVSFCRAADLPTNCLPSLHVSTVTLCLATLHGCTHWGRRYFPVLLLIGLAMIISTLTFKQHYLLDAIAGAVLGYASWWLCFRSGQMKNPLKPASAPPALLAALFVTAVHPSLRAGEPARTYRSAAEIITAAPETDWRTPDSDNLLYMELASGRVIIELAPQFAPEHVGNIRTLARAGYWDGTSIYRSQDNFVVQFGDANADDPERARPLGEAKKHLPAEFHRSARGLAFERLPDVDGWAKEVGFAGGFPAGRDPARGVAWLAHCYGTVGAGRSDADDSSIGTELYVAIGQAPRQLDDNITVVGRVLSGMELLSTIRRGPPPSGFYEDPRERTPIRSIRLASQLPESERTRLQVLRTDSETFRAATEARRNRVDGFYKRPAGHIDLCNAAIPTRTPPAKNNP